MKYNEYLAKVLKNPTEYLWFPESWSHSYLDGMARDFIERGSPEEYFVAVLIFHQLVEELLRLLIRYSNLVIKASIYPIKVELSNGEDKTLGGLIKLHRYSVQYKNKSKIIRSANRLNDLRQRVAHKIIELPSEISIIEETQECEELFEDVFENWKSALKWFHLIIDDIKTKPKIQKLLKQYE